MRKSTIMLLTMLMGCPLFAKANEFEIEFGILGELDKGYFLEKRTNKIPYITKKQGQVFGAVIEPSDEDRYETYAIFYLPKVPSKLTGDTVPSFVGDPANVLRSPRYWAVGMMTHAMWLDEGDPAGEYKVEIYINDKLVKTIQFEVVKQ